MDVTEFATWGQETRHTRNAEHAKLLVQNVQELDLLAFDSDKKLVQDLMEFHVPLWIEAHVAERPTISCCNL